MTTPETNWLTEAEQQAWRAYLRASRELNVVLDRDLQAFGLSLTEYEILSMVSEAPHGQIRMSVLAEGVVQSRSRVTHTAARLERRGWVGRIPAPEDGRGVLLTITDSGREMIARVAPRHVASVRRHLIDAITPEQFADLGATMQRVAEGIAPQGGGLRDN